LVAMPKCVFFGVFLVFLAFGARHLLSPTTSECAVEG